MTELTGYTMEEMNRLGWFETVHPDIAVRARARARALRVFGGEVLENEEWPLTRADGTVRWVHINFRPIQSGGANLAIIYDITGRKREEAEKEKLQAQLLHAQKLESVGRLAGGIAHDFNNMLVVIMGYAELALVELESNPSLSAKLNEVIKAAQRSADLTRQLLAFARKQTASPRVLDLNETVSGMLGMLHRLIGENVVISWKPGGDLWPVLIDPAQVDQILANLVVNARDAIDGTGEILIESRNIDSLPTDDPDSPDARREYVLLEVSDNGPGMDEEVIANLFEPFFTTKEMGKGTGLGLATVYGIVKQNGGLINVYSGPGRGASFKIHLPRAAASPVPAHATGGGTRAASGTETILVAEDERGILELIATILKRAGYTVLPCPNAKEALESARNHEGPIHLLLSDVVMPGMNGKELQEQILALQPNIKTVFMSGYPESVIANHGIIDTEADFIQKPFAVADLIAKIREVLDRDCAPAVTD